MKNLQIENTTVGEFAARYPQVRAVFEKHGIDYCCGGDVQLRDALRQKGLDEDSVLDELEAAVDTHGEQAERVWYDAPLDELVDHIVSKHHTYIKTALPRIGELFHKVLAAHSKNHGRILSALRDIFYTLRGDLELHLFKEEQILFPYIHQAAEAERTGAEPPEFRCPALGSPITQMIHEHDSAGKILAIMRTLTSDYSPPEDACATFCELYRSLEAMERDLHEHIHLENSILFPRALKFDNKSEISESE